MTDNPNPPRKKLRLGLILGGAVVALAIGLGVGVLARPYVYSGIVIQSSQPAPAMTGLVYDDGTSVDLAALRGEAVLIYFGYTHCPDLCPATLSTVNKALEELGSDADRINTFMVTVDPERDHLEDLGDYVRHFDDRFRGIWGSEADVRSVATQYGVHFEYDEADEAGDYLVAHSTQLLVVDPDGVLRLTYPAGVTPNELSSDLKELLK